jgi:dienelactone hydrolase
MAEVLLFHHALGQTEGFLAFADELRRAGHTVHGPDLFDGRTFASIDEGMAYAEKLGFPHEIIARAEPARASQITEVIATARRHKVPVLRMASPFPAREPR